jgi:hypothetical protein
MKTPQEKILALQLKAEAREKSLPNWPEGKRGTPNTFLRSALFSAAPTNAERPYLDGEVIASQKGFTIKFTGKRLNQEDLTLWETLVHMAREHPLGVTCEFTSYGILKAMNLGTGGEQQKRLHEGIRRLAACLVEIEVENSRAYFQSLIVSGVEDKVESRYTLELSKSLSKLYVQSTWVDWDQRIALRRKPLAQALHGYYSSHKEPYPVKLETLQALTGSKNKQKAGFKRLLSKALDDLVEIGFLEFYRIEDDRIIVSRKNLEGRL